MNNVQLWFIASGIFFMLSEYLLINNQSENFSGFKAAIFAFLGGVCLGAAFVKIITG